MDNVYEQLQQQWRTLRPDVLDEDDLRVHTERTLELVGDTIEQLEDTHFLADNVSGEAEAFFALKRTELETLFSEIADFYKELWPTRYKDAFPDEKHPS